FCRCPYRSRERAFRKGRVGGSKGALPGGHPARPEACDQPHNYLGKIFMREGNAPEAIAQFEQALRLHPDFPEAEENLRLAKAGDPQFPSQSPSRILVGPCSARLAFSAYCSRDR